MLSKFRILVIGLACLIGFLGCKKPTEEIIPLPPKDYMRQLPPGEKALVKLTDPSQWPDFHEGYHRRVGLEEAVMNNLVYLSKPSSKQFWPYLDVSHARAVASSEAFLQVLQSARSPEHLDSMIKERFDIYMSRGCDDMGSVLFTGYYRPIFDARLKPDGEFRYPLYRRPADLERDPVTGKYGRKGGGPYLTRGEIDRGALQGKAEPICYLRDRFEAYIVTVQGSGRFRLADGSFYDIGYHGDNGHEYSSPGQSLVERCMIRPEELSLQSLIAFFKQHPEELDNAIGLNRRYVFFTERSGGPFGSLNVPVTPFRSIATDKDVYPRASVAYMITQVPARTPTGISNHNYAGFAMDQDTGGAIRTPGRCDFFLGTGPEVGELAGRTLSDGKLYYIFVKEGTSGSVASPYQDPITAPRMDMDNDGF
ncbi:MAG: murein transglycosylase [Phycisphaerales bacterium]|nr:murein transglycosylase [Phycisphaerales bacterium]